MQLNFFLSNHLPEFLIYVAQYFAVVVERTDQFGIGFQKNQLGNSANCFPKPSKTRAPVWSAKEYNRCCAFIDNILSRHMASLGAS